MSSPINSVTSLLPSTAGTSGPAMSANDKAVFHANLHKVAKEFETVMVHQLLEAAKMGGSGSDGGYKSMVVDAAANGISQAGGLGLAKQIEDALSRGR